MSHNFSFEKSNRLLNKNDFQNLRDGSRFFISDILLFYVKKNSLGKSRIGLAVSTKYGKANKRNRVKRIIREYFRTSIYKNVGDDILVSMNYRKINQKKITHVEFEKRIIGSLENAFGKEFKR